MLALPSLLEVKLRPDGRREVFPCRLLDRQGDATVLDHRLTRDREVAGVRLEAGMRTIAYFWTTRAYNVYHWIQAHGGTVGFYFNAARDTMLFPDRVEWTDLGLDLLVLPDRQTTWIDEEEVTALAPADREAVGAIRRHLEEVHPEVVAWVELASAAYRERVAHHE
jgi:protein associated with RNAse G/E